MFLGIDPLINYLEKRLKGIPVISPVSGPALQPAASSTLERDKQIFNLIAYADGMKPTISCMQEFLVVDKACSLLELASGEKLPCHRKIFLTSM